MLSSLSRSGPQSPSLEPKVHAPLSTLVKRLLRLLSESIRVLLDLADFRFSLAGCRHDIFASYAMQHPDP